MAPRSRKGRRSPADKDTTNNAPDDAESIPLAHPSQNEQLSTREMKSLYELAAERQLGTADDSVPTSSSTKRGKAPEFVEFSPSEGKFRSVPETVSDAADDVPIPPLPDTILTSLPLSILHGTLSFVAAHLYLQEIPLGKLVRDTIFIAFPTLTFLIHFSHGHIISFDAFTATNKNANGKGKKKAASGDKVEPSPTFMRTVFQPTPRNFIFLLISILLGAQMIAISNDAAYYAVMKKAPPVGTLWVWCVLEMSPGFAALGLLLPMGWAVLWKGYGIM